MGDEDGYASVKLEVRYVCESMDLGTAKHAKSFPQLPLSTTPH